MTPRVDSLSPAIRLRLSPNRKNWQQSLNSQDSPPNYLKDIQEEIVNEPSFYDEEYNGDQTPPGEDNDGRLMENTGCNNDNITLHPSEKKKRRCDPSIERRFRKKTSKGHGCTKCARFRLNKYFTEVSRTVCISCLCICSTCGITIFNSPLTKAKDPLKKARNPQCNTCAELQCARKKCVQRLRMQTLRLKKSLKP